MPAHAPTLDDLRRYAVARTLFAPTTLPRAIDKLGFVQADPIRAPARAQDLTLRHRVAGYRAGDLERRYPRLAIEEDCLVNYGFLPRRHVALLHPRTPKRAWDAATHARAADLLAFIRERGPTHPRDVLAAFDHGRVIGYWGGTLNATTQLLDGMHYRGLLRVARREQGTRVYEAADTHVQAGAQSDIPNTQAPADPDARARALLSLVIAKYAPLPATSLSYLARLLEYGAPQARPHIQAALRRQKHEAPSALIDGQRWFWPEGENPTSKRWRAPLTEAADITPAIKLLAPFDPIVWDRRRFELLWGWTYKFEAYTPPAQRRFGHYALPLLWGDRVIGWANASVEASSAGSMLNVVTGYADGRGRRDRAYRNALDAELARMAEFLGCGR